MFGGCGWPPLSVRSASKGAVTLPPDQEPEPDGTIVRGQARAYLQSHPGPADVTCVIEVADSSLDDARTRTLGIYARSGIAQYVIVNLVDSCIEVYEEPSTAEGQYSKMTRLDGAAMVPLHVCTAKRLEVPARDLLPSLVPLDAAGRTG